MRIALTLLSICFFVQSRAQEITQSVRGRVIDKESRQPIPGVNVVLQDDTAAFIGTTTDADGRYTLVGLSIGRHEIQFSFIGYLPQLTNNIIVNSGRQTILNIELEESAQELEAVEISASRDGEPLNEMAIVSARQFNVSETERYAGSRGEPSRMASNFAGVQGADDSRNDIVIRGNSPQSILWRLEDVPISNPNHFNIPGTAGGSVSILNNLTLGNSDFYTGAFPAEFGNANAGVFDLNMRSGNNEKHEFIGEFGFLGTKALLEGPINREKNITYVASYRYSTLALIGGLGINYGTDAIPKYQDGSFYINVPGKGASSFSVFGVGGWSDIDILISDQETPAERNIYGDNDRDQYFGSQMGVVGASYTRSLNEKSYWKTVVAYNHSEVNSYHELVYRHLDADSNYQVDSLHPLLDYAFRDDKIVAQDTIRVAKVLIPVTKNAPKADRLAAATRIEQATIGIFSCPDLHKANEMLGSKVSVLNDIPISNVAPQLLKFLNELEPQQISAPLSFDEGMAVFMVCERIKFVTESGKHTAERGPVYKLEQNSLDLSVYDHFRKLTFTIDDQNFKSYAAFKQGKNILGFYADGVVFYRDHVCKWRSKLINPDKKTGSFDVSCPSGRSIAGQYKFDGKTGESFGFGVDTLERDISYHLGPVGSSNQEEIERHFDKLTKQ